MIDDATLERGLRARPPADPVYRSQITSMPPTAVPSAPGQRRTGAPALRLIAVIVAVSLAAGALLFAAGGPSPAPAPSPTPVSSAEALASATADLLDEFIAARVAGSGAEAALADPDQEVPLLYATTAGDQYERGEWEPIEGIVWPYGLTAYRVRMVAGETVVEQLVFLSQGHPLAIEYRSDAFGTDIPPTLEDGRPVSSPDRWDLFDGEVTIQVAYPWIMSGFGFLPFGRLIPEGPGVPPTTDGGQRHAWDHLYLMADPPPIGTTCEVGPDPGGARALADQLLTDPGLEATAAVTVPAGTGEALVVDVTIGAAEPVCAAIRDSGDFAERPGILFPVFNPDHQSVVPGTGLVTGGATGWRMRLYLVDAPEGSSLRILAIAVVAPEASFERAVGLASPIVASLEFHPRPPSGLPLVSPPS